MNKRKLTLMLFLIASGLAFRQQLAAQYAVPSHVLGNGGTELTNSNYRMVGTIGQPAVGVTQNASNKNNVGFWYQVSAISSPSLPPWSVTSNTPSNATIAVPAAINPTLGTQPLQTGDAIGVFFEHNGNLIRAGYGIWKTGQNLSITAWGDNPQTSMKDGFAEGELIRNEIWNAQAQREYSATATYQIGSPNYTTNGIYVLSSLIGMTTVTQSLAVAQGWNMISGYVEPADPALEKVFAGILSQVVIMKNGAGQVFWPSLGINQIGNWNIREGYQIFMQSAAALFVTGNQVVPESTPIALGPGWNLVAYLRNSPMSIETALASLVNNLVIVKNGAGQVYWPALGINQIGSMVPGQGYQMYLAQASTLTYPANSSSTLLSVLPAPEISAIPAPHAFAPSVGAVTSSTGANAVLLVKSPDLRDGDEIIALTFKGKCVGSSVIRDSRAVLTIWGDNLLTEDIVEGAMEGESLSINVWSSKEEVEKTLSISSLTDALTGERMAGTLNYQTDAVWVANISEVQEIPNAFSLEQNYPNPFKPSTLIRYALPYDTKVKLEVYNALGQLVGVLVDAPQEAGHRAVPFANPDLPSGLYFYRLQAGSFTQTKKLLIMR